MPSVCNAVGLLILLKLCPVLSFPRKNADRLKKDRTRPNRPVRRSTAAVFYPTWRTTGVHHKKGQPSAATSHEARPGKPSFAFSAIARATLVGVKQITRTLQGQASSWDSILTPARDATQRRGATSSRRATVGLDTKDVTKPCKGSNGDEVQDSEPQASRPQPREWRCDGLASRGKQQPTDLHQGQAQSTAQAYDPH